MVDCKTVRIFAYSSTREHSNKRSGTRLRTESETWGQSFFSLASHALRACKARALRARQTLTACFTDFFTDFEKKNRLFCSPRLGYFDQLVHFHKEINANVYRHSLWQYSKRFHCSLIFEWHLITLMTLSIETCVIGGHPVLSGHYSIPRGCPLNTGFTVSKTYLTQSVNDMQWRFKFRRLTHSHLGILPKNAPWARETRLILKLQQFEPFSGHSLAVKS